MGVGVALLLDSVSPAPTLKECTTMARSKKNMQTAIEEAAERAYAGADIDTMETNDGAVDAAPADGSAAPVEYVTEAQAYPNGVDDGETTGASLPDPSTALAILVETAPIDYVAPSQEVVAAYIDAGFAASAVEGYERDLADVQRGMYASTVGWVEAGEKLNAMRARTQHGSWGFLLDRVGLSDHTAQRMMAAHMAYATYPQLAQRVQAFSTTALTLIGQRKDVTPAAIDAISSYADAGEATIEIVMDEIKKAAPVKERKPKKHKTFFANMDPDRAHDYRARAMVGMNEWTGVAANAGANITGLQKSPDFKAYVKSVLDGDASTELQRSVAGFLAFCYIIDHPHDGSGNAPQG